MTQPNCVNNTLITIKDFGRDREFDSFEEFEIVLIKDYKEKHVTIVYPLPSGILRTTYVSIDKSGSVRRAYGDQSRFDFSEIKNLLNTNN